jgi:SAM-dependent methyltransferase
MDLKSLKDKILSSKDESAKRQFMQDLMTDNFMELLNDINFGKSNDINRLVELARNIDSLKGWPEDPEKFWDIEAPFWYKRLDDGMKLLIADFIRKNASGKILNIGAGSTSYVDSVDLDISSEMLNWNPSQQKVQADALALPFKAGTFDSVIAVFVANYMQDMDFFISEISRVMKKESSLIFVQAKSLNPLHQMVENQKFSPEALAGMLRDRGFGVRQIEKEKLIFLRCKKA